MKKGRVPIVKEDGTFITWDGYHGRVYLENEEIWVAYIDYDYPDHPGEPFYAETRREALMGALRNVE